MRIYKNRMPTGVELSIFKKPGGILHSARCSLHTLEKSEQVFTNTTISFLFCCQYYIFCHSLMQWALKMPYKEKKGGTRRNWLAAPPKKSYDNFTSTSTPAGKSSCIKASIVWALGFSRSIRRRWVRISKCSRESLLTWGERNTQYTLFFVGSGTGPIVCEFELRAASSICWHACSINGTQYDRSLIRIFCFGAACEDPPKKIKIEIKALKMQM